jgi:predicted RNase H-like HicB family nuclease
MKIQYPVLIEKDSQGTAWGIIVPDLPGCFSAADKEADILDNAREAILLHLEALEDIPKPSSLESIDSAGFTIGLVDVDLSQIHGAAKRINIIIPAGVLARIDAAANAAGMNRSAFLTEAAIKKMSS